MSRLLRIASHAIAHAIASCPSYIAIRAVVQYQSGSWPDIGTLISAGQGVLLSAVIVPTDLFEFTRRLICGVPRKGDTAVVVVGSSVYLVTSALAYLWLRRYAESQQRQRRERLLAAGLCPTCEYNLTGNTSGTCPECGTAILPKGEATA